MDAPLALSPSLAGTPVLSPLPSITLDRSRTPILTPLTPSPSDDKPETPRHLAAPPEEELVPTPPLPRLDSNIDVHIGELLTRRDTLPSEECDSTHSDADAVLEAQHKTKLIDKISGVTLDIESGAKAVQGKLDASTVVYFIFCDDNY